MGSLVMGYLFVIITVLNSSITHATVLKPTLLYGWEISLSVLISVCTTTLPLGGLLSSLMYKKILVKLQS
jgi:hypothetical protein